MLSFAWLASDHLITIPGKRAHIAGQHLFEALSTSLAEAFRTASEDPSKVWAIADNLAWRLRELDPGVCVAPAGLHGLGILKAKDRVDLVVDGVAGCGLGPVRIAAALGGIVSAAPEELVTVPAHDKQPEVRLHIRRSTASESMVREHLCGWLQCFPGLRVVCFALICWTRICWTRSQARPWPLGEVDICMLLLQVLQEALKSAGHENTIPLPVDARASLDFDPESAAQACDASLTEAQGVARQVYPGKAFHLFFGRLLELTRAGSLVVKDPRAGIEPRLSLAHAGEGMQALRVALLRTFQQLCVDRHVLSIFDGSATPNLRSKTFIVRDVRKDAPLEQIEQNLQALGLAEVRAWLDAALTSWPILKVDVRGTREELAAAGSLIKGWQRCLRSPRTRLLTNYKAQLLVDRYKDDILRAVAAHPVIIIKASTGSGKSTGVPRMMLEDLDLLSPKRIICTQPRRIGATSLAQRLADVCGCAVGEEVGYRIGRASEMQPGRTHLVYQTTAIAIVQFLQGDVPCTHLIVDEVHNRTIFDDILLAIVRAHALKKDRNLKILLMSAATDCDSLAKFFCGEDGRRAPVLDLAGTLHPIQELHLDQIMFFKSRLALQSDAVAPALLAGFLWHLHREKARSSRFLVFLAGRGDITALQAELYEIQDDNDGREELDIRSLHSGIPIEKQMQTLAVSAGSTQRMIVLATDVVESSVTMPDVDVVVDSCLHKRKKWNAQLREYQLCQELITKDEALQRRGRTGRLGPGEVYRLIASWEYQTLANHATPQMQSASISEVLLSPGARCA
mmetsp:Transcript_63919/g.207765  ORF Transcript_63919/g.207765 Transcript_63919/m.207765 type:complete len:795 (+) Transcript_63919:367-2751(+)